MTTHQSSPKPSLTPRLTSEIPSSHPFSITQREAPLLPVMSEPVAAPASGPTTTPLDPDEPNLHRARHIKYWLRCLKTVLPAGYVSMDVSRLSLAFFSVSALDLLGELESLTTPIERQEWIDWIYSCQLPSGSFRGSPATQGCGGIWDVANLPACYFALAALSVLGDDFGRVDWIGLGRFVKRCQRQDGSFGEWVLQGGITGDEEGEVVMGGEDMRFMYCAMAVRWFLKGRKVEGWEEWDVDTEKCVEFIRDSTAYDNGFSAFPFIESHAGHAYCALSALSLLNRLHPSPNSPLSSGVRSIPLTLRWLVNCQIPYIPESYIDETTSAPTPIPATSPASPTPYNATPKLTAGFHGRINKRGDTCYSFWVGGALDVLGYAGLMDQRANRRFLLTETQHIVGGFGKLPGREYIPDILHSYLGLAALAIMDEKGLKKIDSALCMSLDAKQRVMGLGWWRGEDGE